MSIQFLSMILGALLGARQMEKLDRGLVAIQTATNTTYLSWRLSGAEVSTVEGFNVYREGRKITAAPVTNSTNFVDNASAPGSAYRVRPIVGGIEMMESGKDVAALNRAYLEIPLQIPPGGTTPAGDAFTYSANDASTGDLDGDGEYEIVVKWYPSNAQDNAFAGYTGNTLLDAYKLDGTRLWRIDLGRNIRSGAHYTQFQIADFDGDGKAELACQTADGTIDGTGKILGDAAADWRAKGGYVNTSDKTGSRTLADGTRVADLVGRILTGPEYVTVFAGKDGKALATAEVAAKRGALSGWGDLYANRSDRFLAASAYLDGNLPSYIMGRGYYGRLTTAAWDFRGGKLSLRWFNDAAASGRECFGQGNHNMSVGDVDQDGKDEIVHGACAIDDDGKFMYRTGLGHGDAMHLGDLDPDNPGLEVWEVHESGGAAYGYELHDAKTGKILWGTKTGTDNGRGMAADIVATSPGHEMWSSAGGLYSSKGKQLSSSKPSINFRVYWDGDLQDELLDGTRISKWNGDGTTGLFDATGCASNNGSKSNPMLVADLFGDWREEVIWRTTDSKAMRIYTTTIPTTHRLYTLMHDPVYRNAVAWQNTAYNQPPHLGFWLGAGVDKAPKPDIHLTSGVGIRSSLRSGAKQVFVQWIAGTRTARVQGMASGASLEVRDLSGQLLANGVASSDGIVFDRSVAPGAHLLIPVGSPSAQ